MPQDTQIDYEALVENAMRGVLRTLLERIAREGLPGEHHLYISFITQYQGVAMPDFLRTTLSDEQSDEESDEMTIILQHQFDNLSVSEAAFSVRLRFGGKPADMTIPFAAVTSFLDPYAEFGMQYAAPEKSAIAPQPEKPRTSEVVNLDAFRDQT